MSQSELHKELVLRVAAEIKRRYPRLHIVVDMQQEPGAPVPPRIGGYRPDVYADSRPVGLLTVIAEAKTNGDIDRTHTYNQLLAFIGYLESRKGEGHLIVSVTGVGSDHAKTVLRFLRRDAAVENTALSVYDGLDLWSLELREGVKWLLI